MAEGKKGLVREFSAGGVVYKSGKGKVYWLLIKPAETDRWQLPKGLIDEGESAEKTAVREVFEETGIEARIIRRLDTIQYFYYREGSKVFKRVTFFLMGYEAGESKVPVKWRHEIDEARWFETEEAIKRLSFENEKKALEKAQKLLEEGGIQEN